MKKQERYGTRQLLNKGLYTCKAGLASYHYLLINDNKAIAHKSGQAFYRYMLLFVLRHGSLYGYQIVKEFD